MNLRPKKMAAQGLASLPVIGAMLVSSYTAPEFTLWITLTAFCGFIGGLWVATVDANWSG